MDLDKLKNDLLTIDQYKVEVDVAGMKEMHARLTEWMGKRIAEITARASELGIEDFNINSSKQKSLFFEALGIETKGSASKKVYSPYIDKIPEVKALSSLMEAENLRRQLEGSAKSGISFYDFVSQEADGRWIFKPEVSITDGRIYQKRIYSMPMQMRSYIKPYVGSEFVYFDLSAAELTLLAHYSGNKKLLMECRSGQFWERWYKRLGVGPELKQDIKTSIYACIYSLMDYAIPRTIGKRFYKLFFECYPGLEKWLQGRVDDVALKGYNESWGGSIHKYDFADKKWEFKALNYPLQKGLANIVLFIANELSPDCYVATINFDSIMVSGISAEELKVLIQRAMDKAGVVFNYKMNTGANYREAQGE